MNESEIIKRTIEFCAAISTEGLITETTYYGHEALAKLAENPDAVSDFLTNGPSPDILSNSGSK